MSGVATLSYGILEHIMNAEQVEKPVLQILQTKKKPSGQTELLRLLLSDGKYFTGFVILAPQLNQLHAEGKLEEYTIIQVDKYITSVVNKADSEKRALIIHELTVLNAGAQVSKKIGNPIPYTDTNTSQNKSESATPSATTSTKPETKPNLYNSNNNSNQYNTENAAMNQTLNVGPTRPISSLSPYQNKWTIKARVTSKTPIRNWSNAKGEGKLFSMDLMDESGEIRAVAFNEHCDRLYDMIEVDHVYFISKCQLKLANKQFSSLKNDYEMTFTGETVVQPCEEMDTGIPKIKYELVPISQITNIEPKAAVDVIGICKEVGALQTFTSRNTNKEYRKRDLTLVDSSNAAVSLTLWGDDAVNFDGHVQSVILVKGARVNEFNGAKSLSLGSGSVMKINPDIPEGHKLRGWFDNGGGENISNFVSALTAGGNFNAEWLTFHEARAKSLGSGDKADYFQCKAVVHIVKSENPYYKACHQCNKKVIDENNGHYRCERCNAVFPDFKYSLLVNMSIGDWTSNRWVTCFNDVAEQLLKRTAQEIGEAMENNSAEGEEIFSTINFNSYVFKLRSKAEMYGGMQRNKLTVQSAAPINYKEYNKYLINNLKQLTGIHQNMN